MSDRFAPRSLTRRGMLSRFALGAGVLAGAAALQGITPLAAAPRAQDEEDEGEGQPFPFTGTVDTSAFEMEIRQGPSRGLRLSGTLILSLEKSGVVNEGMFNSDDGQAIPVVGQVNGRAVHLVFTLPDGRTVFGVGTRTSTFPSSSGQLGGPLVGPEPGDSGDWVGTELGQIRTPNGTTYLVNPLNHTISRSVNLQTTLFAGGVNLPGFVNSTKLQSRFRQPSGGGSDGSGTFLYIADTGNQAIRRIPTGTGGVTTVITAAATGRSGLGWTDCAAPANRNFIAVVDKTNHCVWRHNLGSTTMNLYSGTAGTSGFRDGPLASALFQGPDLIESDTTGNLLTVRDQGGRAVRLIDLLAGNVSTLSVN